VTLLFVTPRLADDRKRYAGVVLVALAVGDLFSWGAGYNPASPPARVYPTTPGLAFLSQNAGNGLVAPINTQWSLGATPPPGAVLPPNAATVYGFRDMGGYDSLLRASSKNLLRSQAGGADPSPPENGNMAFVKSLEAALQGGARWIVLAPDSLANAPGDLPSGLRRAYGSADMIILENQAAGRAAAPPPANALSPTSYRVGLFLGVCALGALCCAVTAWIAAGRRT